MHRIYYVIVGSVGLLLPQQALDARNFQSLEDIDQELQNFLDQRFAREDRPKALIDQRLKLKKCQSNIAFKVVDQKSILIACPDAGWRFFARLRHPGNTSRRSPRAIVAVKRGQPVTLVVSKNGFRVSRQMLAVQSGHIGDFIPVKATRRAQPIMAQISGIGEVTLNSQ